MDKLQIVGGKRLLFGAWYHRSEQMHQMRANL